MVIMTMLVTVLTIKITMFIIITLILMITGMVILVNIISVISNNHIDTHNLLLILMIINPTHGDYKDFKIPSVDAPILNTNTPRV